MILSPAVRRQLESAAGAYWFHLSAVFLPCPVLFARGSGTASRVGAIVPWLRRAEKLFPNFSSLRKNLFMPRSFPRPARLTARVGEPRDGGERGHGSENAERFETEAPRNVHVRERQQKGAEGGGGERGHECRDEPP